MSKDVENIFINSVEVDVIKHVTKKKRHAISMDYAKIYRPKMRSVYWKYFGYPSNDQDHIITKQNVICVICQKILSNHGNTTNLRAHIQAAHKIIFAEICKNHAIKVPARKTQNKTSSNKSIKRDIKNEYHDALQETAIDNEDSIYLENMPLTYDEITDEDLSGKGEEQPCDEFLMINKKRNQRADAVDSIDDNYAKLDLPNSELCVDVEFDSQQLTEALVKMIVKDLKNVSTIYDSGMSEFLKLVSNGLQIPQQSKINNAVKQLHTKTSCCLTDQFKVHSQVKFYSLGFDIWLNIDNTRYVSIYFNFISEEFECNFRNELYCTVEYNNYTIFGLIFEEFNLENCAGAVVNLSHEYLDDFLKTHDIPIILCFSHIINDCLKEVFSLETVSCIIDEVIDVMSRYTSQISLEDTEIPAVNKEFPWTYYELLNFFNENVTWPEDVDNLLNSAKMITDLLSPIAVTLEALKEEAPYSSMLKPIASKLINKHYFIDNADIPIVASIKNVIVSKLNSCVLSSEQLTLTALLDPRFHRFITIDDLSKCLVILDRKFKNIIKHRDNCVPKINRISDPMPAKKRHLEMLFDVPDKAAYSTPKESLIENELTSYRKDACASLDESPIMWWNKWGHEYGSLKLLSELYNCLPCFVNMMYKNPFRQQIDFYQRRYMLSGKLIDQLLYLHHNIK